MLRKHTTFLISRQNIWVPYIVFSYFGQLYLHFFIYRLSYLIQIVLCPINFVLRIAKTINTCFNGLWYHFLRLWQIELFPRVGRKYTQNVKPSKLNDRIERILVWIFSIHKGNHWSCSIKSQSILGFGNKVFQIYKSCKMWCWVMIILLLQVTPTDYVGKMQTAK